MWHKTWHNYTLTNIHNYIWSIAGEFEKISLFSPLPWSRCWKLITKRSTGYSINRIGLLVQAGSAHDPLEHTGEDPAEAVALDEGGPRHIRGGQLVQHPSAGATLLGLRQLRDDLGAGLVEWGLTSRRWASVHHHCLLNLGTRLSQVLWCFQRKICEYMYTHIHIYTFIAA